MANPDPVARKTRLRCQWREIVALNFEVEPKLLNPYVPDGTYLDSFHDHHYVTLLGKNIREIQPFGRNLTIFRSVNFVGTRFYVVREVNGQIQRGFCNLRCFISNKWAGKLLQYLVGRAHEPETIRRTTEGFDDARRDVMPTADYYWKMGDSENHFKVKARSLFSKQAADSKEHFFLHPGFMYVKNAKGSFEYAIRQAPWLVWDAASGAFDCDTANLLGSNFRRALKGRPSSVLLSRGGDITISKGLKIG